jgi:hypothetical protein
VILCRCSGELQDSMQYRKNKLNVPSVCLPQISFCCHDIGHLETLKRESCPSFSDYPFAAPHVVACSTTVSQAGGNAVQRQLDTPGYTFFSVAGAESFEERNLQDMERIEIGETVGDGAGQAWVVGQQIG